MSEKIIHIVVDPMCSWCWGFAPEVHKLRAAARGLATVRPIVGGLRPGTTEVMDDAMKQYISHHWEQVHEKTGQPFDHSLFERDDFIYDTEPGCRALVAVRELAGDEAALDMVDALHEAFYARARDIAKADVLAEVAGEQGMDVDAFRTALDSDAMKQMTLRDFQIARQLGVTGFPTVVCEERTGTGEATESQFAFLTLGYRPFAGFQPLLAEWLGQAADGDEAGEAEGDFCAPGGAC